MYVLEKDYIYGRAISPCLYREHSGTNKVISGRLTGKSLLQPGGKKVCRRIMSILQDSCWSGTKRLLLLLLKNRVS